MISRITLRVLFGGLVLFRLRLHCILIVFDIENLVPGMFQFFIFAILIFATFLYYILTRFCVTLRVPSHYTIVIGLNDEHETINLRPRVDNNDVVLKQWHH